MLPVTSPASVGCKHGHLQTDLQIEDLVLILVRKGFFETAQLLDGPAPYQEAAGARHRRPAFKKKWRECWRVDQCIGRHAQRRDEITPRVRRLSSPAMPVFSSAV